MLNLDQVRLLENRVERAVDRIQNLSAENRRLTIELETVRKQVLDLESLVNSFKDDQGRIEEGILNALERLSAFEEAVLSGPVSGTSAELFDRVTVQPTVTSTKTETKWDDLTDDQADKIKHIVSPKDMNVQENPGGQIGIF